MPDKIYLPSTTPGQHWNIYVHKPGVGRVPYANAIEGTLKTDPDGQWTSFSTIIDFQRPAHDLRTPVPGGRMTAKAQAAAIAELTAKMHALGLLA